MGEGCVTRPGSRTRDCSVRQRVRNTLRQGGFSGGGGQISAIFRFARGSAGTDSLASAFNATEDEISSGLNGSSSLLDNGEILVIGGRRRRSSSSFVPWGRGDGGHIYDVPRTRVCNGATQTCDISRIDSRACVIPGHSGGAPINNGTIYTVGFGFQPFYGGAPVFPVGTVITTKYPNGLRFRNTTTIAHPLSGTVDRIFDVSANGSIFVTTVGRGDAFLPTDTLNEYFGPGIFRAQNQICAEHLGG